MYRVTALCLFVLVSSFAASQTQTRLEISEYLLPPFPGGPGSIEFERELADPLRDSLNMNINGPRDSLTQLADGKPIRKSEELTPAHDSEGNTWKLDRDYAGRLYTVTRNDTSVFRFHDFFPTDEPHLWLRGEHWWIESLSFSAIDDTGKGHLLGWDRQIVLDGKLLSEEFAHAETFDYHPVGGKPFFFFRRDSTYGWNYSGIETVTDFDEIFFATCCEPAISRARFYADQFQAYARRDSTWYMLVGQTQETK